ncbi:hypothetical protein AB0D38_09770 [Streptomyces sp. NPDC048279]|uniref:hypothetical protein n=1 Tax=Streptomyces sp. NPDC048279 TaxID=3154714 RepID=UPI0034212102
MRLTVPCPRAGADRTVPAHGGPGRYRLEFWVVDPTVVVQRLLIDTGGLTVICLGRLESRRL